ncbi:MAG: oligosaccharide flippase family protein [Clostridia bacterium]|nr:oligosaccharide flippase family protein [Clostridia bacterium]
MRINQIKFGAVASYVSYGLNVVLTLLCTPLMIHYFGDDEFGVYQLVLPIVSSLSVLTFGLGSAYTRYYSIYKTQGDETNMARLNGMFLTLYSVLGLLAMAIGFVASFFVESMFPDLKPASMSLAATLIRLMSINMGLSFPVYVFTANIIVNEAYFFQKIAAAIKMILNPLITIPLLLLGFKSVAVATLAIVLTVGMGIADVWYCFKKLAMKTEFRHFDLALLFDMLRFTFFVFLSNIVDQINWSVDRYLLGALRYQPETEIAIYGAASQLNIYFMSMATMFSGVFTPRVHRLVASHRPDKEVSDLFIRVGRIQFMVLSFILVGFVAVGQGFMRFYTKPEFVDQGVYIIALMLMVPTIVPSIQNLGIEIQQAKNKHKFRAIVYFLVALANIGISIPFTLMWGGVGAALGTSFTVAVGNGLLMNWYYHKHIGLDIKAFWKAILRIALAMLVPLGGAIAIARFADIRSIGQLLLWGAAIVVVEAVFMWTLGMQKEDRELILSMLRRLPFFKKGASK